MILSYIFLSGIICYVDLYVINHQINLKDDIRFFIEIFNPLDAL